MKLANFLMVGAIACASASGMGTQTTSPRTLYEPAQQERGLPLKMELTPRIINFLTFNYADQKREIPFCMMGQKKGNTYHIDDLVFPHIVKSDSLSSWFYFCKNRKYLGMLHNHVDGKENCGISDVDFTRFVNDEKARLEAILCSVYIQQDTTEPNLVRIKTAYKELIPRELMEKYKRK